MADGAEATFTSLQRTSDRSSDFPLIRVPPSRASGVPDPHWSRWRVDTQVTAAAPCRIFTGLPKVDLHLPSRGSVGGAGVTRRAKPGKPAALRAAGDARPVRLMFEGARPADLCFCETALAAKFWLCFFAVSLVAGGVSGCHAQQAVVEAPPAPAPPPPPPPPPPPAPPPCVELTENCTATEATLLGIGQHGSTIVPPSGWKFAKLNDRSVAVSSEGKSILAALEIPNNDEGMVLAALEKLSHDSALEKIKFDALKKRLKKPQISLEANGAQVDLWEVSKATGNGSNPELHERGAGTLLVFVVHVAPDRFVTGLGFVVVPEAQADAEKVMTAVQSVKGSP